MKGCFVNVLKALRELWYFAVAFLGASSAQKIWIKSRTSQQQLQSEKFLFNQQAEKYSGISEEERIKLFSERMMQIWNEVMVNGSKQSTMIKDKINAGKPAAKKI